MPEQIKKVESFDEKNKREQLEKESTPFGLTNLFIRRPFLCLIITYAILMILTKIALAKGMYSLDDTHERDFLVWNDPTV